MGGVEEGEGVVRSGVGRNVKTLVSCGVVSKRLVKSS